MKSELYDLIIIGASAAGCTAAIYAARRGLNFIVLSKDIGGEVALSGEVENWPGIIHTTGIELAQQFEDHMRSYKANIHDGVEVTDIVQEKNYHIVKAKNGRNGALSYKTKSVIIASGIHPRELGVPGEKELKGKGVTYCTVCDGPLFRGKVTATIGAGNSALESALMMAGIASKVYVFTKYPDSKETQGGFPKGESILISKLKELKNVEIIYNAHTTEIQGSAAVEGVVYEDVATKEKKNIPVQAVMVHIGMIPNSSFVTCSKKSPQQEIEVGILCETSCPGVYAAGDVTNIPYKQIVIAAGQGSTAALSAIDYINRWKDA